MTKTQHEALTIALATAPKIKHVGKEDSKRFMVSIKNKRRVAEHMKTHKLKPHVLATVYPERVTGAMLKSWGKDNESGKYKLSHAVSVSRA